MSDKMFRNLLISVGVVVVACIVVIAIYAKVTGGQATDTSSSSGTTYQDPAKKIDVTKLTALKPDSIWSESAFMGSKEATHKLVVYSDLFCPYCRKSFEAIEQNMADFKATYLDSGKMSYELRVTDLLSNSSDPDENYDSTTGGEVVQCAAKQNHFWDYLKAIEAKIYDDYYSKGLGDRHYDKATEPDWKKHQLPRMETSYFTDVAKTVDGMDMDKMETCIKNGDGMKQLKQYSQAAAKAGANSFPSFFLDGKQDKTLYAIDNTYDYDKFYKSMKQGIQAKIGN